MANPKSGSSADRARLRDCWLNATFAVATAERRLVAARVWASDQKFEYMRTVEQGSLRLLQVLRSNAPDLDEVEELLASGDAHPNYEPADPRAREASALSVVLALGTSEQAAYHNLIPLLSANGADVNEMVPVFNSTLLAIAIRRGLAHSASLLVECGADALRPDENGYTPLHLAAHEGRVAGLVGHLIAEGASPDKGTNILPPASLVAVEEMNGDTFEAMMRHGGDPNAVFTLTGDTAATMAVHCGQPWLVLPAVVAWGTDLTRARGGGQTACELADDIHIRAGHAGAMGDVGVFLRTFIGLGDAEKAAVLGNADALRAAVAPGKPLPQQFRWVLDATPISVHCAAQTDELRALILGVVQQVEGHSHLTHHLFGVQDRARVCTVLLTAHRLATHATRLPPLPAELWHLVIARSMRPALAPASDELALVEEMDAAGVRRWVEPTWSQIPEMVRRLVSVGLAEFVPRLVRNGVCSWPETMRLTGAALVGKLGLSQAEAARFLGAMR